MGLLGLFFTYFGVSLGCWSISFSNVLVSSSTHPESATSSSYWFWEPGLLYLHCLSHMSPEPRRDQFTQFGFTGNDNRGVMAQPPHLLLGLFQFTKYFLFSFFHFKNKGKSLALDVHLYAVGTQQAKQEKK